MQHYAIDKPLRSFHKFNEASRENQVIEDLKQGKNIALISDAGTPGISDPGERLVQECASAGLEIVPIPGACAAIAGISASGLTTERFQFLGFLPRKDQQLRLCLLDVLAYTGTSICYEAPTRLVDLLQLLSELAPHRHIVVAREITKKFEEFRRGTAAQLLEHWQQHTPKGEVVVMIGPPTEPEGGDWDALTPEEHVAHVQQQFNISRKEAIKVVADLRNLSKRDLYKRTISD